MPESSARSRTCTACPDSLPDTAKLGECSLLLASRPFRFPARSSVFSCAEHIQTGSAGLSKGISRFCWLLGGFSGFQKIWTCSERLYHVVGSLSNPTYSIKTLDQASVTRVGVTKVLETVRKYLNRRAKH